MSVSLVLSFFSCTKIQKHNKKTNNHDLVLPSSVWQNNTGTLRTDGGEEKETVSMVVLQEDPKSVFVSQY